MSSTFLVGWFCDGNTKLGEVIPSLPPTALSLLFCSNQKNPIHGFFLCSVNQDHLYTGEPAIDLFVPVCDFVLCIVIAGLNEWTGGGRDRRKMDRRVK